MKLSNFQIFLSFIYALALGSAIFGAGYATTQTTPTEVAFTPPSVIPQNDLGVTAQAAAVYDIRANRFIYLKNEQAPLPIASLAKVMTALVASNQAEKELVISRAALATEGDTGLRVGERWRIKNLIDFTLVGSSNDGAAAIALAFKESTSTDFVTLMNEKAQEIGLQQTYFLNETGLDVNTQVGGGYTSAKDIAYLFSHILKTDPSVLESTQKSHLSTFSLSGNLHEIDNTNKSLDTEPLVFASKTGFTDLAGGNLAVAFDAGPARPMVAVVLGSTLDRREADIHELIEATFHFLSLQTPNDLYITQADSNSHDN